MFVTLNTILHDNELEPARRQIHELYDAGVDALIVQDMGVLELDIPPIELHASTQCDIRSLEKAQFLDQAGFSQLVLARELNLQQIRDISGKVDAAIEFFIHGALCVAFSGQCNISHAQTGRSANRGDCSQACRLPYTLKDNQGRVVAYDKHLLSMKDNNQTDNLLALVEAGVRSFKIEGRYKDMGYVKNITAHYRQQLDAILQQKTELVRASSGRTEHFFVPNPDQTFHRGSTDYFVNERKIDIGAFDSPKFVGLPVGEILSVGKNDLLVQTTTPLANGDGLNVLHKREVVGFRVNTAQELAQFEQDGQTQYQYRLLPNEMPPQLRQLRQGHALSRNLDHNWQQALQNLRRAAHGRALAGRAKRATVAAEGYQRGGRQRHCHAGGAFALANNPERNRQQLQDALHQLGNTLYFAEDVVISMDDDWFVPASQLKSLRREAIAALDAARLQAFVRGTRKAQSNPPPVYPTPSYPSGQCLQRKARAFYHRTAYS